MEYTLTGIKVAQNLSEETYAFTATLYQGTKSIAYVSNSGRGGSHLIRNEDGCRELVEEFNKWCEAMPPFHDYLNGVSGELHEFPMDNEMWINNQIDAHLENQRYKRQCKKSTLILLKEHSKGESNIYRNKYPSTIYFELYS